MSEEVQSFRPTNGRVMGVIGIVMCVAVAVVFVVSAPTHAAVPGVLASLFAGLLVWAAMLRPGVAAVGGDLHNRTHFESVSIPLAAIDGVVVRRYLLVRAGGHKYICPAISRSLRKTVRTEMKWKGSPQLLAPGLQMTDNLGSLATEDVTKDYDLAYADFVEKRIMALADTDRAQRGIAARSEEEYELGSHVVRRKAWLELGGLVVLAVAFVVALVI